LELNCALDHPAAAFGLLSLPPNRSEIRIVNQQESAVAKTGKKIP
jgi:hypothetical protein